MSKSAHKGIRFGCLLLAVMSLGPIQAEARPQKRAHTHYVTPMVVAAEPEAANAGMAILKRGGTVADAAVAIQAVLALVEPQSSSLSGGAFMLYYDGKTGKVSAYNGREKAPAAADGKRFLKADGTAMSFKEAVLSGRATGVPGAMFMLEKAHEDHGKLPWSSLFGDPIKLAEDGFTVSPRLGKDLQVYDFPQTHTTDSQAYFSNGQGGLLKTGDVHKNPLYATTLHAIAKEGMSAFRKGPLADAILAKVNASPLPGGMSLKDLQTYQPEVTAPVCAPYRIYIICENPAPSGGVPVLQAMSILQNFPMETWGKEDPRAWAAFIEAERLMYADRDKYVGDPDFVPVPTAGLLDSGYNAARASTIHIGTPSTPPKYGTPPGAPKFLDDQTIEPGGTTHFVIIDRYGNALTMTTTVESIFGTGRMVGGFFLNNQLTDFSFSPVAPDGLKAANAVEPGKRPRSAMSPTFVFDRNHKLVAMFGSPGGISIVAYNIKTLIGVLDWNLSMQDAINLPNVVARGDRIGVDKARMDTKIYDGLAAMGYTLTDISGEESGINGLLRQPDGSFAGGADLRREGVVVKGH